MVFLQVLWQAPGKKYVRKWIVGALLEDQAEKQECNWRLLDAL